MANIWLVPVLLLLFMRLVLVLAKWQIKFKTHKSQMNQRQFGLYFLFLETLDIRNNSVHCQQLISFFSSENYYGATKRANIEIL